MKKKTRLYVGADTIFADNEEYSIEEDLEETMQCLKKANKEIERLNNIITYLEQYFNKREDYRYSQLVRETKEANIEWLKNAIKEEK